MVFFFSAFERSFHPLQWQYKGTTSKETQRKLQYRRQLSSNKLTRKTSQTSSTYKRIRPNENRQSISLTRDTVESLLITGRFDRANKNVGKPRRGLAGRKIPWERPWHWELFTPLVRSSLGAFVCSVQRFKSRAI